MPPRPIPLSGHETLRCSLIVSANGRTIPWPSRSSDFNPIDLFIWGTLRRYLRPGKYVRTRRMKKNPSGNNANTSESTGFSRIEKKLVTSFMNCKPLRKCSLIFNIFSLTYTKLFLRILRNLSYFTYFWDIKLNFFKVYLFGRNCQFWFNTVIVIQLQLYVQTRTTS